MTTVLTVQTMQAIEYQPKEPGTTTFYGDRSENGDYMLGAYIVKLDKWKDPQDQKIYDAVFFKFLTRDTPSSNVKEIFEKRKFVIVHSSEENPCKHIEADPEWHKKFLNPPKEIVWLTGNDDKTGERIKWDVGCSTYSPTQLYKKEKFYKAVFGIKESSKLSNVFSYIFSKRN